MKIQSFIIVILVVLPIQVLLILAPMLGMTVTYSHGFAIDSEGTLYIGEENRIIKVTVSEEREVFLANLHPSYKMVMSEPDRLLVMTGRSETVTVDLKEGSRTILDGDNSSLREKADTKRFVDTNGETYHLRYSFARMRIEKDDGTIVYREPVICCLFRVFLVVYSITFLTVVVVVICKLKRHGLIIGDKKVSFGKKAG